MKISDSNKIQTLISQGRYFEARSQGEELLKAGTNPRISQLLALTLSKSGAPEAALEFLVPLFNEFPSDPETAGILGGVYKQLFRKTQESHFAILSRDTYLNNFNLTNNYYTGINAATMSAIAGHSRQGKEIAAKVIASLEGTQEDVWTLATMGEAHLLIKERTKALDYYFKCRKMAGSNWGSINSVYHQLWLLKHYFNVPSDLLSIFKPPGVAAFTGHMIDHPGRENVRFPASIEGEIKQAIVGTIKSSNIHYGYCSLACGGDIIFAESLLEAGGELVLIMPFNVKDFVEVSVKFAGDSWVNRFEKLRSKCEVRYVTEESYKGDDNFFFFQNKAIFGGAMLRSRLQLNEPMLVTVLSSLDLNARNGGTRESLKLWPNQDRVINIDPDLYTSAMGTTPSAPATLTNQSYSTPENSLVDPQAELRHLLILIFDLVKTEKPELDRLFELLTQKATHLPVHPETTQVTNHRLTMTFTSVRGIIALANMIKASLNEKEIGKCRISLHAGPITVIGEDENPIVSGKKLEACFNLHSMVSTGAVYGSDFFTALMALEEKDIEVEFAGIVDIDGNQNKHEVFKIYLS